MNINYLYPWLKLDSLNSFVVLAIGLFFVLTVIYSVRFMKGQPSLIQYYTYIILTAIVSVLAVLANHLILLLVCWGFLGLTLYLLINWRGEEASAAAKKTFIIVGGSDALMLLGIGIIYYLTKEFQMDKIRLELNTGLVWGAFLSIAVGCFAKAGAMPFHSWIPDCAQAAPVPVVAYLPASLDKLLGIYLLTRISLDLFLMNQAMSLILMIIGAFTIVAAAMMALIQHSMKRLLGYSTVSQVGYMVLGLSTGLPIGIAGGLFHLLNHAIYKFCLFLTAGNVEYRTESSEFGKLGGLAKFMPITYASALIASFSISGVPPFNGFFSKWMIYQGLIERLSFGGRPVVIICLIAAMFGSGLTLAAFMKLVHATFLGQPSPQLRKAVTEVSWTMWLPCLFLASLCVIFGIFANQIPMRYFILPAVGGGVGFIGDWYAGLSTLLILFGFFLGLLLFSFKTLKPVVREDVAYVGGEDLDLQETRVTGTEFYNTLKELKPLRIIYKQAQAGTFDIYEQGKAFVFGIGRFLQFLHNGVLPTYLVWSLLGMIALFFALVR